MGIQIGEIIVKNYRSLQNLFIELNDDYTVIIGKNNSGKSNIIRAIVLALSYLSISREDVYFSSSDPYTEEKKVQIDIRIVPVDINGQIADAFSDMWGRSFGSNVTLDIDSDKEYFAFRTELAYDADKEIYINSKYAITSWSKTGESKIGVRLSRETIEAIDVIFVDAQRDISTDLRDKTSIFGRLASKINIPNQEKVNIQQQLQRINKRIVGQSDILQGISNELSVTTGDRTSTVEINPITRNIEALYKGMDIYYTDSGASPISVDHLGLGVRSWAVFSTVKAEAVIKEKKAFKESLAYHPLSLFEEPEAHIHPQAQRQLFASINKIAGQKIVTTHSPYILSKVELSRIRYVCKNNANTSIVSLDMWENDGDKKRKICKSIMETHGDILFANLVILVEGNTEEQMLTIFIKNYFGKEPFELGINILGVDGSNYSPYIQLLNCIGVKWYVFSDGEPMPVKKLKEALKEALDLPELPTLRDYDNIIVLENDENIERYLISQGYGNEIISAINDVEDDPEYLKKFIKHNHGQFAKSVPTGKNCSECKQQIRSGTKYDYKSAGGTERAVYNCIIGKGAKTKYAARIAEEICKCRKKERRIPGKIVELFISIKNDLTVMRVGD